VNEFDALLHEVQAHITFGVWQRDKYRARQKISVLPHASPVDRMNNDQRMYWTGFVFAMRLVEQSMERLRRDDYDDGQLD